jgi:predicted restriction endonuclease
MSRPKGCIISPEHRQKLRESRLGKKASKETRLKLSLSHKGQRPWAKGKHWKIKDTSKMHHPSWIKGKTHSIKTKRKISESLKGHIMSEEQKRKIGLKSLGRKHTIETIKKMSDSRKGKNNPMWQGGKTAKHLLIRCSLEYRLWRKAVYERDNYTCVWCGDNKGNNLEADHIKPFYLYPELRFAIDNGRTLCRECHKKTNTYGRPKLDKHIEDQHNNEIMIC